MKRLLVCAVLVASSVARAADNVDPATVTCQQYNSAGHQGKVDIGETMFAALHNDNRWTMIPEGNMLVNVDDACAKFPNAKIIDALQQWPTAKP